VKFSVFSPLGDQRWESLRFIQEAETAATGHINFIKRLSTVRNGLAHKIENVALLGSATLRPKRQNLSQRLQ